MFLVHAFEDGSFQKRAAGVVKETRDLVKMPILSCRSLSFASR